MIVFHTMKKSNDQTKTKSERPFDVIYECQSALTVFEIILRNQDIPANLICDSQRH